MTREDKQSIISICRILADKMDDSGKVAIEQVISAVESMVEQESVFYPQEKPVIAKTITSTDNTSGKVFNENGDYVYPSDVVLETSNTATLTFVAGYNIGYRDGK